MSGSSSPTPTPSRSRSPSPSPSLNDTIRSMIPTPAKQQQFDKFKHKHESEGYLRAVSEVPICSFKTDGYALSNYVEDFEGKIMMSDVGSIKRSLINDRAPLTIDGIGWCVKGALDLQLPHGRFQTTCFNTNACLTNDTHADIQRLDQSLQDKFCSNKGDRIFDRKFVLLPFAFKNGSGFTLLLNGGNARRIYHFRSGIIENYESEIIPKVLNFLEMFCALPRYKSFVDPVKNADVKFVNLGTYGSTETAFQMLHSFRAVLKMAEDENYTHHKMNRFLKAIKNEEVVQKEIVEMRTVLATKLENDLNEYVKGDPVGSVLRQLRYDLEWDAKKEEAEREEILASRAGSSGQNSSFKLAETPKRKVTMKRKRVVISEDEDSDSDAAVTERVKTPRAAKLNASKRRTYFNCDDSSKENDSD